jgi:hypothetical protein
MRAGLILDFISVFLAKNGRTTSGLKFVVDVVVSDLLHYALYVNRWSSVRVRRVNSLLLPWAVHLRSLRCLIRQIPPRHLILMLNRFPLAMTRFLPSKIRKTLAAMPT